MQSFIEGVVNEIWEEYSNHTNLVFVLPSKRAGTFLKKFIAKKSDKTFFSPDIYSIETFIEQIAGLKYANNTEQLFELYNTYLKTQTKDKEGFYSFSKWGQTALQDFNEIDRYLIDAENLFSNLAAIQEINHWSVDSNKTKMMDDYLAFWNNLKTLYQNFNTSLLQKGKGHQGLVYRKANEAINDYIEKTINKTHIFIGFNALNTSESNIIQTILATKKAKIYWDIDEYFLNDSNHDASLFIRQYRKQWKFFQTNPLKGISTNYLSKKNIQIVGVPKNVSQAKYVGNIVEKIDSNDIKNTAIVLGDETLLNPLLNAIPKNISSINITMGYQLKNTPFASFFIDYLELYLNKNTQGWFHESLLSFLSQPNTKILLHNEKDLSLKISETIKVRNWSHISAEKIFNITKNQSENANILFTDNTLSPHKFVEKCHHIIKQLKAKYQENNNHLALEYLYRFHTLFNQIQELIDKYTFITDLKSLRSLFKEALSSETLDFVGDPIEGLQIMGMLESRNLDFETVIITSVNEGILPSGKSNNSFIPIDLKLSHGLPIYKEKDAVYTYHFYRLIQRAKNVHIIYNTEPDVLEGGEKSRLISQLLTDENKSSDVTEKIAVPKITPTIKTLETIKKGDALLTLIKKHAEKGFSPSSLSNYIRNPLDFYKNNLLKIDTKLIVEETVAANTFGTIVHDTLEEIYTPFIGEILNEKVLKDSKRLIKNLVKKHFAKTYFDGDISRGKNLIAFNVIIRYLENFIDLEIKEAQKKEIKIIGLEQNFNSRIDIPELNFPVKLKGKLDRVDEVNGITRIVDYKTGKVENKNVTITQWEDVTHNYDMSKAFQLLCYATMYNKQSPINELQAGIISFKNLKPGTLYFNTKIGKPSKFITPEILSDFKQQLKALIIEICNPDIPFIEKEV